MAWGFLGQTPRRQCFLWRLAFFLAFFLAFLVDLVPATVWPALAEAELAVLPLPVLPLLAPPSAGSLPLSARSALTRQRIVALIESMLSAVGVALPSPQSAAPATPCLCAPVLRFALAAIFEALSLNCDAPFVDRSAGPTRPWVPSA